MSHESESADRIKKLEKALEVKHFSSCSDGSCDASCKPAVDCVFMGLKNRIKELEAEGEELREVLRILRGG